MGNFREDNYAQEIHAIIEKHFKEEPKELEIVYHIVTMGYIFTIKNEVFCFIKLN